MSASLHKSPSEGELSELHNIPSEWALSELASNEDGLIEEELLKINKVEVKRTKSFGSSANSPVLNNRSRRSSGVRVVWRTTPTAELENLNRVLGIPKRSRSPSPRAPAPPVDHVFSESFDPLSVHVRPLPDSADSQTVRRSTSVNSTSNLYNKEKRAKRQHSFESSDMTSVKDLRSLFEELVQQRREISDKNALRRAKTLAGYELLSHEITSRHSNLRCNKNQITHDVKPPIITQEVEKNEEKKLEKTNSEKQELPSKKIPAVVVEPLPPVKHLRNIFEKYIPNDISSGKGTQELKVIKGKTYNNSESINRDIVNNLSDKSSADAEAKPVVEIKETTDLKKEEKTEIQKDKTDQKVLVRSTSTSVSNLKAKWEALMNSSEGSYKPKQKNEKNKILKSSQSITSQHSQDMKITITSESSKATSPHMNDYALLEAVKDSNHPETHQPIERTTSLRNSVRNMALLYENRNFEPNMNLGSRSSSTPSITPAKTDSLFVRRVSSLDVSFDSVSSSLSPVTSAKINPIVTSKSLENLKQRFTDEDNSNVKEENLNPKENSEISYKEISLGSLERKASVRDLKKKFEERGNQEENPQRGNENSNKVCKIQKKEKKDNYDISLKMEEANEIKSLKMNSENLNNESETIKKGVEIETRKDNHENEDVDSNTYEDNFTNYSTPLAETKLKMENKKNLAKIENLVKEFVESEGLTEFLEISNPPKDQKTNHFENSFLKPMETPPNSSISKTSDIFPTSLDTSGKVSDSPPFLSRKLRSFSTNSINMSSPGKTRELNPDEMKYFETLQSKNSELNASQSEGRSRSSTVGSLTPATTQFSVDTTQKDNPTTSTSTKFRHLHSDELKFFETTGISPKLTKRSSSDLSLRHETLDKALRISSPTDEISRQE